MGKQVGKLIKAARTDADLTQEQLARRISGLSANDISLAERGEKDLTQAQLKKIATKSSATKNTTRKTTTKSTAAKAKTPASANSTMKVTATERKLVEAYRLADSDAKKRALSILKGEENGLDALLGGDVGDKVSDVLEDVLGRFLGAK